MNHYIQRPCTFGTPAHELTKSRMSQVMEELKRALAESTGASNVQKGFSCLVRIKCALEHALAESTSAFCVEKGFSCVDVVCGVTPNARSPSIDSCCVENGFSCVRFGDVVLE